MSAAETNTINQFHNFKEFVMSQYQKVTLVFPSLNQLWAFVREVKINYIEVSAETFSLVCNCQQADIDHAKDDYGAVVS